MTQSTKSLNAKEILDEIKEAKGSLRSSLEKTTVIVHESEYPEVVQAVVNMFGEHHLQNGVAKITFPMVAECLNVVTKAGKAKAEDILNR